MAFITPLAYSLLQVDNFIDEVMAGSGLSPPGVAGPSSAISLDATSDGVRSTIPPPLYTPSTSSSTRGGPAGKRSVRLAPDVMSGPPLPSTVTAGSVMGSGASSLSGRETFGSGVMAKALAGPTLASAPSSAPTALPDPGPIRTLEDEVRQMGLGKAAGRGSGTALPLKSPSSPSAATPTCVDPLSVRPATSAGGEGGVDTGSGIDSGGSDTEVEEVDPGRRMPLDPGAPGSEDNPFLLGGYSDGRGEGAAEPRRRAATVVARHPASPAAGGSSGVGQKATLPGECLQSDTGQNAGRVVGCLVDGDSVGGTMPPLCWSPLCQGNNCLLLASLFLSTPVA